MDDLQTLARALKASHYAVVLTGAGASTDSGLPDFRSKDGLWKGVDPARLASISALRHNSVEFYQFYRERLSKLQGARPNAGHHSLAALQTAGVVKALITQNVDGLHQAAGSPDVIEVHGSLRECVCLDCDHRFSSALLDVPVDTERHLPRCPDCSGLLKPGVVLFGEELPGDAVARALQATRRTDLFLVVGSSLEVGPVNQLPAMATMSGADLAIINLGETHLDGRARWLVRERSAKALESLCALMDL